MRIEDLMAMVEYVSYDKGENSFNVSVRKCIVYIQNVHLSEIEEISKEEYHGIKLQALDVVNVSQ